MNSLLYHCFPSLFMALHSLFTYRKYHQPFRQLIERLIIYMVPLSLKEMLNGTLPGC